MERKRFWSALLGNLFEHYDTALFGCLSPFLAPLFFPEHDPLTALILTYAIIPLGIFIRPLGAIAFGYIGDRYGREQALFLSLCGMSLVSGCIALCPTFNTLGFFAPTLLAIGRIAQNFFAAGETMGGAIYILEDAKEDHHDVLSGFYNASTIGGILLAAAAVFIASYFNVIDWAWRVLYAFGCLTAFFGCLLRWSPKEKCITPFLPRESLKSIFWKYKEEMFTIAICSGFSYACYSIALVLMNGFIPLVTSTSNMEMAALNTTLLVFDFCLLPFFGWLASKVSRERLMCFAALATSILAIPLCLLLQSSALSTIISVRVIFIVLGVAFCAPLHAWFQNLIPAAHRYVIISFSYAMGSQLLGAPTAAISLWFFQKTGMIVSIAWYWMFLAFCSFVAITKASSKVLQTTVQRVK